MPSRLSFRLPERIRRIPTADLYVINPLRHLLRDSGGRAGRRIRHVGANAYLVGETGIVVRYGSAMDLERLRLAGARRLVYVADDDFAAGAADASLPERYRARLAAFAQNDWPVLAGTADAVVVSSPDLAAIYGPKARLMHPVWPRPPAATDHFARRKTFELVHFGTASHDADFAPLVPILATLLATYPQLQLTLFGADGIPAGWPTADQVRVRRPMAWWRYKLWLPRQRFHMALYPLTQTRWNAARSSNKLFEQALTGAAPLMSANPALLEAAGPDLPEIFVEADPADWARRIAAAIADPAACRARADAVRARILEFDAPGRAARTWSELLGPDG